MKLTKKQQNKKTSRTQTNSKSLTKSTPTTTYAELFNSFDKYREHRDPESSHSIEDEIMEKFILDITSNKLASLAAIRKTASQIKTRVLDVPHVKWFAG